MIIVSSSRMRHGTFQAKYIPLSKVEKIKKIYVIRKSKGPKIPKVKYIILPKFCRYSLLNFIFVPIFLTYYVKKMKADYILGYHLVPHGFFTFFASLITRKPHIICQTGGILPLLAKKPFLGLIIKKIISSTKVFNVPGQQSIDFWIKQSIPKNKLNILHSTIDTDKFSPSNDKKDIDFLYVGALNERKRVKQIIYAFKSVTKIYPKAKLGIVGKGPDKFFLFALVSSLGIKKNVIFYGFQKNIKQYISRSKIFVMYSTIEGLPVALMEAMSCGKVVIAPKVDNIPSVLVSNNTGFLLSGDNLRELKDKLIKAYDNYDELKLLRENARNMIIDRYSYNTAIKKWEQIL